MSIGISGKIFGKGWENLPANWFWDGSFIRNRSPDVDLGVYDEQWVEEHSQAPDITWRNDYLSDLIKGLPDVNTILDIGCASGNLVGRLNSLGYMATGLDIVQGNISFAQRHFQGRFLFGKVENLIGEHFDLVVLSHILEHLTDVKKFLCQIKQLLGEKGNLLISVPNYEAYQRHSLWRGAHLSPFSPQHQTAWTATLIKCLLQESGFKVKSVVTRTSSSHIFYGIVFTLGRMLLTRKRPAIDDKALISIRVGALIHRVIWGLPRFHLLERWVQHNNRGKDLVIIAGLSATR